MSSPRKGPPRGRAVFWTPERVAALTDYLEQGWDDARVARAMGTTATAVLEARHRHGITRAGRQGYTSAALGHIFGYAPSRIRRWMRAGHLTAYDGPRWGGGTGMRLVRHGDLLAFMEAPAHWHRWEPERIARDSGLWWWARGLREGVRFLTVAEVAARYCAQYKTVLGWIERGEFPGRSDGCRVVVLETDLADFAPPGQRPRRGQLTKRGWSSEDDAEVLARRARGESYAAIGYALRRSAGAVGMRHSRLTGHTPLLRPMIRGDEVWRAKITVADVRAIRAAYAAGGVRYADLGTRYGVSASAIGQIVRRERWRWLHDAGPADD